LLLLKKTKHQHQGAKRQYRLFSNDFFANSCRCLRKQSINIKNQKSRMTSF